MPEPPDESMYLFEKQRPNQDKLRGRREWLGGTAVESGDATWPFS